MAKTCVQMTLAEKEAYEAANPTHTVFGPYSSEDECNVVCAELSGTGGDVTSGGISVGCCPDVELPVALTLTIITTLVNTTTTAVWDEDIGGYVTDLSMYRQIGGKIILVCQEGQWYITGAQNLGPGVGIVCDPFQVSVESIGGPGAGFYIYTE